MKNTAEFVELTKGEINLPNDSHAKRVYAII